MRLGACLASVVRCSSTSAIKQLEAWPEDLQRPYAQTARHDGDPGRRLHSHQKWIGIGVPDGRNLADIEALVCSGLPGGAVPGVHGLCYLAVHGLWNAAVSATEVSKAALSLNLNPSMHLSISFNESSKIFFQKFSISFEDSLKIL